MTSEIGGISVFDDRFLDLWTDSSKAAKDPVDFDFSNRIFRDGNVINTLSKNVAFPSTLNKIEKKTTQTVLPMGFRVEGKLTVEWGGSDGVSVSGSASGNVSDDNGNQAEAEVTVNSDGSGSASVSVSHDEDSDS